MSDNDRVYEVETTLDKETAPSSNSTINGIWYSVSMIASFCVTVNSADNKEPIRRCNSYCPYYIQENLWNQPKMSM